MEAPAAASSSCLHPSWVTVSESEESASDSEVVACCSRDTFENNQGSENALGKRVLREERRREAPSRFKPEEFWRRELPQVAKDRGTQLERTLQIAKQRSVELAAMQAAWLQKGKEHAEDLVKEISSKLLNTAKELACVKEARKAEAAAALAYKRQTEAAKRQKAITQFFMPQDGRPRPAPEALGEGYTDRNITSKTFSHHVTDVEVRIIELSRGDPLKQLQLAAAVNQRMHGIRALREKDHEAWGYVRNSLKAFFETLQDRYLGRYPNHVRAAQQAVCAAIANAAPPRKLHVISEAVGVSVDRLSEGRKHWSEWVGGDRESIMDLRGKARADGMPDAWIEFAIDIWKTHTRRSERAKDSVRNPNDKCVLAAPSKVHLQS